VGKTSFMGFGERDDARKARGTRIKGEAMRSTLHVMDSKLKPEMMR
jgi:hypothetical protein